MASPLDKATSKAPSTIGDGCVRRYDPDELNDNHGTEFPEAAQLWQRLQETGADDGESDETANS